MNNLKIATLVASAAVIATSAYGFIKARQKHALLSKTFAHAYEIDKTFSARIGESTGEERAALELRQSEHNSRMLGFRVAYLARALAIESIEAFYAELPSIDSI